MRMNRNLLTIVAGLGLFLGGCAEPRPPLTVTSRSERMCPEGVGTVAASRTRESRSSFAWSVLAPSRTGPQRWLGEAESHGSGRDTRYGTEKPKTSAALAVLPPDDEK